MPLTKEAREAMLATLKKEIVSNRKDLRKIDEGIIELMELRIAKAKKILAFKAQHDLDEPVGEIHDNSIAKLKRLERRHVGDDLIEAAWRLMFATAIEGFHGAHDAATKP